MGYFSNSTEGSLYQAKWCVRCVHEDYDNGCTVMQLHFFFQDEMQDALSHFIPKKKVRNKKCTMFVNRKKLRKKYRESTSG